MINLSSIRTTGVRPRVHGNGFIQLDLTERSRLHIWGDPRIPSQKVATPIHNHVFGFESTILVGRVINVVYMVRVCKRGDYRVYTPWIREGEDTTLVPTATRVAAHPSRIDMIDRRTSARTYDLLVGEFHETVAPDGPAATIIIKDDMTQAQGAAAKPGVLVPVDQKPDNNFNRYNADEDLLWRIIEDTLKLRNQ